MNAFARVMKKLLTGFLAVLIAVSTMYTPIAAPRAHAYLGIFDTNVTDIVEFTLNGLAWAVAKAAVNAITKSTVNWINSGFNGSPAFVTNLQANLLIVADQKASQFFTTFQNDLKLKSPFSDRILGDIALAYYTATNPDALAGSIVYDLGQYSSNDRAFLAGDFSKGGLNAWWAATQNCPNNAFCLHFQLQDKLAQQISSAGSQRLRELDWGKGFLSWRGSCATAPIATPTVTSGTNGPIANTIDTVSGPSATLQNKDACLEHNIETPGSVVENQLEKALGKGVENLQLADSINEIVGALASQLVVQVMGGGGLRGTSQVPTGGGRSYTTQLGNESTGNQGSLSDGFIQTIQTERTQIAAYRSNWQVIHNAAVEAESRLKGQNRCANSAALLASTVEPAITKSDAETARADTAIASLEAIATQAASARTQTDNAAQATAFGQLSSSYQTFLSSASTPTPEQMGDASFQASDTVTSSVPVSTYTQLKRLASGSCALL